LSYISSSTTKNGNQIWLQTTITPIFDKEGNHTEFIAIDSDITAIILAEKEIKLQKEKIEIQRDLAYVQMEELANKKKSITDSIQYAKRIQSAILPSEDIFENSFSEFFIIYRPRDIVSGDFYWISEKENKIIIAVADCTGHGVPGAFMSMLGVASLNEIVSKNNLLQSNEILNKLSQNIIHSLHQTGKEGESKDGLDIALCIIDKDNRRLQYAGANTPLILITNNEITEIKANKMPIGIYIRKQNECFTNHEIDIPENTSIYLFTDGYTDQFGGEKHTKFKKDKLRKLLIDINQNPLIAQKQILEKSLDNWKGNNKQIDDILVVGFKI